MELQQKQLIGHPLGLFILFFTEMWERFSYYGMRALFVLYLTATLANGGQGWSGAEATMLYGWYTGLVYITPIIGGLIADKFWGYKKAILVGGLLMTLGHAVLAVDAIPAFIWVVPS
jgi:POT family proton-dependent oligopeptide transporter